MAAYTFPSSVVLIESTGALAIGATGALRPSAGGEPVQVYDLNGSPIPGVVVGNKGVHQPFQADIPDGVLDFGSVLLTAVSQESLTAAITAEIAATEAAASAAAAEAVAADLSSNAVSPDDLAAVAFSGEPADLGASAVGISVLTAADAAAARSAIGAGTSSLAIGTASNQAKAGNWTPTVADLPAGSVQAVKKSGGTWPARPSTRTDITYFWIGADPAPSIVTAPATGGMYEGDEFHRIS